MSAADKTLRANIEIAVVDRTAAALERIEKRLDNAFGGPNGKKKKPRGWMADLAAQSDGMERMAAATTSLIEKPLRKFASFEEQMDSVTAATFDLTKSMNPAQVMEMDAAAAQLAETARKLGADTKYSATEAAAGMDILAKNFAGEDLQKTQDIIDAMPGVLNTAAATKESIAAAADIQTEAMNQFGLQAQDMGRIGDVLVKTANTSATGLLDLGEALKYSGVTAKNANVDLETTLAMLGALGNAGKKGSVAGTGLASVLGNMQSGMKKQKSALAALGINVADKNGNMRPVVELLAEIDKAADKKFGGKGKGGVRRDRWLQGLVGMGSDKEALAILTKQAGSGELQKLVEANRAAAGTAATVAAAMSGNTVGAARELDSALEELQLTIGEELTPTATEWIKEGKEIITDITEWTKENPELTRTLGALAVALGVAATATRVLNVVMMTNPVVAIATAIGTAAYLIYENWDGISAFFTRNWETIKLAFAPIMPALAPFIYAGELIYKSWEPVKQFFVDLADTVRASFEQVAEAKYAFDDLIDPFGAEARAAERDRVASEKAVAAAKSASNATYGNLFEDDLGFDPNSQTSRPRVPANDAAYAASVGDSLNEAWASLMGEGTYGPAAPSSSEWEAMSAAMPMGPALATGDGPTSTIFKGDLKITIDSNGKVTNTQMTQQGNAPFETRVNRGGQAA